MPPDNYQASTTSTPHEHRKFLERRLRHHLCCLPKDAKGPEMSAPERLAPVRDRRRPIQEIRNELENVVTGEGLKKRSPAFSQESERP